MTARRRHRLAWDALGLLVFAAMAFPVYWMISTAFKPGTEINSYTPTWIPRHPTLLHFHDALHTPYFWDDLKNSRLPTHLSRHLPRHLQGHLSSQTSSMRLPL